MTPALLRYRQLKEENPNTILLYRMGDFYEAFWEDAVTISKVLDIALTSRDRTEKKTPMAGLPYHALDAYMGKLIDAGYKVAVAEQEEEKIKDEKSGKTKVVIHRNISRIVTPSTYERETDYNSHYLIAIYLENSRSIVSENANKKINISTACIDPNGSSFWVTTFDTLADLDNELFKINPSEILVSKELFENIHLSRYVSKNVQIITPVEKAYFNDSKKLLEHLKVKSLKSFGLESENEISAASACFNYISETQHSTLSHITGIVVRNVSSRMGIDSNTLRNLEIVSSSSPTGTSLLQILDHTNTRGGKRLLKDWIISPLAKKELIEKRIDSVKFLKKYDTTDISTKLDHIYDLERVCARISYGTVSPRDLVSLADSINEASQISLKNNSNSFSKDKDPNELPENLNNLINSIENSSKDLENLQKIIFDTLMTPAPANLKDGHFIKEKVSDELDELRQMGSDSRKWLKNLEVMEQQKTGINTLRVKYNRVFGYFLEVSKSHISKVPEHYIRKQTTVNGERYITSELKEKESMILGANDRIIEIEQELYQKLVIEVKKYISTILDLQSALSELDVYISLAAAANLNNYCEPVFKDNNEFHAIDARHPVIEKIVTDAYIYNDIHLKDGEMILITGPNMGGKSTYIRMTSLIAFMAHIGSFVPAKECSLGVIDSIFTRVGASDDLSRGESTFMVEMTEAANILRNATEKSLIILDEIGRGTSTYDGMSIAWAIVYFIHEKIKAKTLFATHYHELTVLEKELMRMSNYTVGISENDGEVIFLRKIEKGKAEKSFGIHVAKIAGLPQEVLNKATSILEGLEHKDPKNHDHQMGLWEFAVEENRKANIAKENKISKVSDQENQASKQLIDRIKSININNLTPLEAMNELNEILKLAS